MSPRAAWRLERLGHDVFDYAAGKMDWLSANLPWEGEADLVGGHLQAVSTCGVGEIAGDVVRRIEPGAESLAVCNDDGMVVGDVEVTALRRSPDVEVGDLAAPGVTTVRASEERDQLSRRMERAGVQHILVTTAEGVLLGAFHTGA